MTLYNVRRRWRLLLILLAAVGVMAALDQQTRDALNVAHILKTIQNKAPAPGDRERSAQISQRELNSYIAWRLVREKAPVVTALTVHLLDHDHVTGRLSVDAARLNLDVLLGQILDFDFKGIVYTRDRAGRFELISLTLGGHPVKPQVLDYVLAAAGMYYGTDTGSLNDWYQLPPGIDRVAVRKDRMVLFY